MIMVLYYFKIWWDLDFNFTTAEYLQIESQFVLTLNGIFDNLNFNSVNTYTRSP